MPSGAIKILQVSILEDFFPNIIKSFSFFFLGHPVENDVDKMVNVMLYELVFALFRLNFE